MNLLEEALETAKSIAFDGCHKIYVLADDNQTELMKSYGYGENGTELITQATPAEMYEQVLEWYANSCYLKFIDLVRTSPNGDEFETIVAQGEELWEAVA